MAARPAARAATPPTAALLAGPSGGALDVALPPGSLRLSGEAGCPRWRGRLHLWAAIAALPAAAVLVQRRPSPSVLVYVAGMIACFSVSSGYHLLPLAPGARRRLRQADHATIYVYTAASVTPLCQYAVGGWLGTTVAGAAWLGALVGVAMKVRRFDRATRAGGWLYLLLGWLAVPTLPRVLDHLDTGMLMLLGAVGLLYTGGAAVLFSRRPDPLPEVFGYHEVWHAAVVAASACYFVVVWQVVR